MAEPVRPICDVTGCLKNAVSTIHKDKRLPNLANLPRTLCKAHKTELYNRYVTHGTI